MTCEVGDDDGATQQSNQLLHTSPVPNPTETAPMGRRPQQVVRMGGARALPPRLCGTTPAAGIPVDRRRQHRENGRKRPMQGGEEDVTTTSAECDGNWQFRRWSGTMLTRRTSKEEEEDCAATAAAAAAAEVAKAMANLSTSDGG